MSVIQKSKVKVVRAISVAEFYESFKEPLQLELVAGENGLNRQIKERSFNRPAAALAGYFEFFAWKRIQLLGAGEMGYLRCLDNARQADMLEKLFARNVPCLIVSRKLSPTRMMLALANKYDVPIIRSKLTSKELMTDATFLMEEKFAPTTTIHGTLLDVRGVGTLICGESGVGKSECALALIERGHSLVADDLTYIKRFGDRELIGASSELSRGYMECRGLGIIDVAKLFGVRSVRLKKRIDLVVNFTSSASGIGEDRTGLDENFYEILDTKLPLIEILVRPGRDLAQLVEVAAMMQSFKEMGHDSAAEFNERLIAHISGNSKK